MTDRRRLVVVGGVPETTQVLRAVFEPRGHRVDRIRAHEAAPEAGGDDSVLVWHADGAAPLENEPAQNGPVEEVSDRPETGDRVRRVIIGSLASAGAGRGGTSPRQLAQPFHYAELIRAVEALLADQTRREAA